jgi:hypothetical protein
VYLLPSLIDRLQPRFIYELQPGTRIVSHAFAMAGWKPDRTETMRIAKRHPGQGEESTLYLWVVPAEARGLWQGSGWRVRIYQNYQEIELEGSVHGKPLAAAGSVAGREIFWTGEGAQFRGRVDGARIVGELLSAGERAPLALERLP